jgi:hypothetical protein
VGQPVQVQVLSLVLGGADRCKERQIGAKSPVFRGIVACLGRDVVQSNRVQIGANRYRFVLMSGSLYGTKSGTFRPRSAPLWAPWTGRIGAKVQCTIPSAHRRVAAPLNTGPHDASADDQRRKSSEIGSVHHSGDPAVIVHSVCRARGPVLRITVQIDRGGTSQDRHGIARGR